MSNFKAAIDQINGKDLEDLAYRLNVERPGDRGNWVNPNTGGKAGGGRHSPALSIYQHNGRWHFKDQREGDSGGVIDFYMLVRNCTFATAVRDLATMYGLRVDDEPKRDEPPRERTRAEWIADKCLAAVKGTEASQRVLAYLVDERRLSEAVVQHAMNRGAIGFNDYVSTKVPAGEAGHGGPGVAFIVRHPETGNVLAVETRYFDAELNGRQKTSTQGDKNGAPWCSDWRRFRASGKVVLVESAINAMTVECAGLVGTAAVSVQGAGNVRSFDYRMLLGKTVTLGFDNDAPEESGALAGYCPGNYWAWKAHEALVGLDIPVLLLEQDGWLDEEKDPQPVNDLNDLLKMYGADHVRKLLRDHEQWAIAGLHGQKSRGKPRLWLPSHDFGIYWKFRAREDFTSYLEKEKTDEDGKKHMEFTNVCGFRVAAVSRVTIASPTATMTGDPDLSPTTVFSVSVQVPRYGRQLQRKVMHDEQLHNLDMWKKFGPVYSAPNFLRLINILERTADIGAREAVNFVGLAWRSGKLVVNEGPDCYFTDPRQQCPYSNLIFPSGPHEHARTVMRAYQATFQGNEAALMLVWALGAHLKAFLGFWPHFMLEADKGTGKTTLMKALERSIGMTMFSGQSLATEFRIITSLSYTSHPVGWDEISARKQEIISKAVSSLQECYQYAHTRRNTAMLDFLLCAPVLLVGESVPVESITGKLVRNHLTREKRGVLMPDDLPKFPVRQWLNYLATLPKVRVLEMYTAAMAALRSSCSATMDDAGAERMLGNYAALRTAWTLLCDFSEMDLSEGGFLRDLTATMNGHIRETASDRQPWVWIVDKLLSEIARGTFRFPFLFGELEDESVLCVRTSHVMDHLRSENSLREFWDGLPVKSDRVFKAQLKSSNVLAEDDVERTVHGKRVAHMVALSLPALEQYGLYAVRPALTEPT